MSTTLYRKYRPQTFADVVNQQHVRLTIEQALIHGRMAHAYIFAGPRGVGKTTVARLLARAAACLNRKKGSEPCNTCASCTAILQGASLDFVEIDAASQTGVDNERENVIQSARAVPTLGKVKAFIIDEVHMLSLAAFNALLKLLEEPPAQTLFILATTELHRVPATIISRTQRFDFKPLTLSDIVTRLEDLSVKEKRQLADGVAERIARAAGGSLRDAESILGQLFSFEEKKVTAAMADLILPRSDVQVLFAVVTAITLGRTTEALDQFHAYCRAGGDVPIFVHELVEYARVLMLATIDPSQTAVAATWATPEEVKRLLELASQGSTDLFIRMVEAFVAAERQLPGSSMEELPIEIAILKLSSAGSSTPPPASIKLGRTEEAPIKSNPKPSAKKNSALLLEKVQAAWPDIRTQLSTSVPSLKIAIQSAEIKAVDDEAVTLAVPFPLHAERLRRPAAYQSILEAFSQKLGHNVKVEIDSNGPLPPPPPPQVVRAAPVIAQKTESTKPTVNKTKPVSGGELWDQVVASFQ